MTAFEPQRRYTLWHDRAVFHFLVERSDREHYRDALRRALHPEGHLVIATFGPSGPERCSGLPTMRYGEETFAAELGPEFRLMESSLRVHQTPWDTLRSNFSIAGSCGKPQLERAFRVRLSYYRAPLPGHPAPMQHQMPKVRFRIHT